MNPKSSIKNQKDSESNKKLIDQQILTFTQLENQYGMIPSNYIKLSASIYVHF